MSYDNKKFLDANGVTQIVGLLDDYATNETLSTVVNSVQTALDQKVDDVQINETSILNNRVANIPIAGSNVLGVVKTKGSYGLAVSNDGSIKIAHAGEEAIKSATIYPNPIIPSTQHISTFYGLSKAAGVDLANETVTFGIYPETSKTAIRTMLGAVGLTDYANQNTGGVVKIIENGSGGFQMSSGYLLIKPATIANVKSGTNGTLAPLVPGLQDASTFYGLAKAAGHDEKDSSESLGTYTDGAKGAIQKMLGFDDIIGNYEMDSTADKLYNKDELFILNGKLYKATATIASSGTITPGTNCTAVSIIDSFARNIMIPIEYGTTPGSIQLKSFVTSSGTTYTQTSTGLASFALGPNTTASGDAAFAEGLGSTASGAGSHAEGTYATAANSGTHAEGFYTNASGAWQHVQGKYNVIDSVGTYADIVGNGANNARSNAYALDWDGNGHYNGYVYVGCNADSTGGTRLPHDIQVNGISVVNNGVANIPFAGSSTLGVVKVSDRSEGLMMNSTNGLITIAPAGNYAIKMGTSSFNPIVPDKQHMSVFYGLATAAGDITQSASDNTVGTYTTEAKTAIQTMLGVENGVAIIEEVAGTTPTITGIPNYRYICGEVSTISITPPTSGTIDIRFSSGSTPAIMTVPSTVKWPEWFDAENLEVDVIYEILITDGVYGSVMTWA